MCIRFGARVRRCGCLAVMALGGVLAACDSANAPKSPAGFSLTGDYVLSWGFLMADEGSLVTPSGPFNIDQIHGTIYCPGQFKVTQQTNDRIAGTFRELSGTSDCFSQQPNFCALPGVLTFCRDVSGTWSGTFFMALLPQNIGANVSFSTSDGRSSVEALTGCHVVSIRNPATGLVSFLLPDSTRSSLLVSGGAATATIDCPSSTGFGRADVAVLLHGGRSGSP
jgi:hypothetical protein